MKASFLVTVDAEGDDLWGLPREITTRNASFVGRFQSLCERYRLKPSWLTNWEMLQCAEFCEFLEDVLARGQGEVGMHLHAWNQPPLIPLTEDDFACQPYLIEYPEPVMRAKIACLTEGLEARFGRPMLSHRAGRYALDETYASLLMERGYRVDCSVTPLVNWHLARGASRGGADYTAFPQQAYYLDPLDVSRPGSGSLLEVPLTILPERTLRARLRRGLESLPGGRRALRGLWRQVRWLRPRQGNLSGLLEILASARDLSLPYVQLTLHSSELMPGGSPFFPTPESIEELYADLERLFEAASRDFQGQTLADFARAWAART